MTVALKFIHDLALAQQMPLAVADMAPDVREMIEKHRLLHWPGQREAGVSGHRYRLFLAVASEAGRTSPHGSDFFFSLSESVLTVL
jgi:hypothetical protein